MRIEIKEPLAPINNPTNVFKLVVSNMHGDGDLYTTTDNYFDKSEEVRLIEVIKFLNWCQTSWPDRDDIMVKWNELNKQFDPEEFDDDDDDEFDDDDDEFYDDGMIELDSTADNQFVCRPEFKILTYFNENGVECKVDVIK